MNDGGATEAPVKKNAVRRLYDWMLSWAERPGGPAALGVISFAESSFFPLPPDPLLLALCLGAPRRALIFGAICTIGSVLGGMFGYLLGHLAWAGLENFFFTWVPGVTPEGFAQVQRWYNEWGFWAVFLAGFTPLPYKVFTLSSGVFAISFPVFVIASVISRGLRFFIEAVLVYFYGPPIARFIDRHFDKLALLFGILLVGGFIALKFMH